MNNRLVILGTNEYQNPLIVRAKELGYETHVFGWKTGAIGESTADVYHDVNIMDYETLWKEVQKVDPCGVASIASELAMHPMNYLLRKMGIPCNSLETEKIATNKYLMRCAMAYSEHARRYLADCGLPKERTYVTGSPMAEVLHNNLAEIEASDIHSRLGLEKGKYILLSAHREENIDTEKNFLSLFNAINKMAEKYDMPILYSCHPRSKKRIESTGFKLDPRVIQHEPLGFHDYNCLQMNAFAVVSDSGTLPEESSFFTSVGHPFPAVCIRTSTERPEALDKACFILSGIDEKGLLQSVDTAVEMNRAGDYGRGAVY